MGDPSDFFHSYEKWVTKSEKWAWTIIYASKFYLPSWQNTAGTCNDTVFTEETLSVLAVWFFSRNFSIILLIWLSFPNKSNKNLGSKSQISRDISCLDFLSVRPRIWQGKKKIVALSSWSKSIKINYVLIILTMIIILCCSAASDAISDFPLIPSIGLMLPLQRE